MFGMITHTIYTTTKTIKNIIYFFFITSPSKPNLPILYLALKENPSIQNTIPGVLVVDKNNRNDFYNMLDGRYKTHTAKKIQQRIEYAKKAFLNESK